MQIRDGSKSEREVYVRVGSWVRDKWERDIKRKGRQRRE